MSDPTVESITKALQETNHFRLPLDLFCETLLKEVGRLQKALRSRWCPKCCATSGNDIRCGVCDGLLIIDMAQVRACKLT